MDARIIPAGNPKRNVVQPITFGNHTLIDGQWKSSGCNGGDKLWLFIETLPIPDLLIAFYFL
jgi:hypothetical protein